MEGIIYFITSWSSARWQGTANPLGEILTLVGIQHWCLILLKGSGPVVEGTWFGTKNHRRFESCFPYYLVDSSFLT